jgi:hypothetical protein
MSRSHRSPGLLLAIILASGRPVTAQQPTPESAPASERWNLFTRLRRSASITGLFSGFSASFDLQHVANPAYNRDRGLLWIPSLRLHLETEIPNRRLFRASNRARHPQ